MELHALLKEHGSFEAVECAIEKYQMEENSEKLQGGWHTEISLAKEGWTSEPWQVISSFFVLLVRAHSKDMIENSKKWAMARGLLEVSEVHGKKNGASQ